MYNLIYFDQVIDDVKAAKIWYKDQQNGLEIKFSLAIELAINQIINMPTSYAPRYKNVRIAHPKTFPYNIHFYIDDVAKTVVLTAIVHNKRDLSYAMNRV